MRHNLKFSSYKNNPGCCTTDGTMTASGGVCSFASGGSELSDTNPYPALKKLRRLGDGISCNEEYSFSPTIMMTN